MVWHPSRAIRKRPTFRSRASAAFIISDAAEFITLGAGNVQVCTAAMTYGFKIIEELVEGLEQWMDTAGHANLD